MKCNLEPNCGAYLGVIILQPHACTQRFRLRILCRTRSNAGRTSGGSLSGGIESIWETLKRETHGIGACLATSGSVRGKHVTKLSKFLVQVLSKFEFPLGRGTRGRVTLRESCNTAARSCPSSLSKFPGRTWTSGSARGKHVIKFVQVPCPSSCPSSGSRGAAHGIGACLESGPLRKLVTRQPAVVQVPCPSSPAELGQGTWITAGCLVIIYLEPAWHRSLPAPARHRAAPARESYGSYGSYGHTAAVWHSNWSLHPGAPPARQRSFPVEILVIHRRPLPRHLRGIEASPC